MTLIRYAGYEAPARAQGLTNLMMTYAPTYCWVTWRELFKMIEYLEIGTTEGSFRATLSRLKREGFFKTKISNRLGAPKHQGGGVTLLYIRIK